MIEKAGSFHQDAGTLTTPWLSSHCMTRNWQRWVGRAVGVVGLLLAAQFAHAGNPCLSTPAMDMAMPRVVLPGACKDVCAPATCVATAPRVDASALAPASPPHGSPPSTEAPRFGRRSALPVNLSRLSARPALDFPAPVYILFGRFLV